MRTSLWVPVVVLAGCSNTDVDIVLKFPSPQARDLTRSVAFTAFEPLIAEVDFETQSPRFVECDAVGVFPPTAVVDLDTITTLPNLAGVLTERDVRPFPLDDEAMFEVPRGAFNRTLNPWGAVMVAVEARGDARASLDSGAGVVTATLLSGCFCLRTDDGTHPDPALDAQVKAACRRVDDRGEVVAEEVRLEPVAPPAFALQSCEGAQPLTAARESTMSPAPSVCIDTEICSASSRRDDCFACDPPCNELRDRRNVPVRFEVTRGNRPSPADNQVALTNAEGQASLDLAVGDCTDPIRVEAVVMGRPSDRVAFDIECVDDVADFDCGETVLSDGQPVAISRLPGDPSRCLAGDSRACDRLVVLSEDGRGTSRLDVIDPTSGRTLTSTAFPGEDGHTVTAYLYGTDTPPSVVAVATSRSSQLRLRVFEWDLDVSRLTPHDGASGLLNAPCERWLCGSLQSCLVSADCPAVGREVCAAGVCQDDGEPGDECALSGPVYCACDQDIGFQPELTLRARDIDDDGLADLVLGNSDSVFFRFLYSSRRVGAALYGADCDCGRFVWEPTSFALANFGGAVPNPSEVDLFIGSTGGSHVQYVDRQSTEGPALLRCGQPLGVGSSGVVRDVRAGAFTCPIGDLGCPNYDDVVTVSLGEGDNTLRDPGAIRLIRGGPAQLGADADLLYRRLRVLSPRPVDRQLPDTARRAQIADFNGDQHRDLAVLYSGSREVRMWLGASNGSLGERASPIALHDCGGSAFAECAPLSALVAFDEDGDGRSELAVVCGSNDAPRIRVYAAAP